ncbi:hypothetical protein LN042_17630 [Kitasatospora sp. RB6PN24]|nr:hypothetical protein [Kitasatospora humi]MCC9308885.1 hypothetical protein [Kitasatospora humi]
MEREINTPGEPPTHAEQAQRRLLEEEAAADSFEHSDVEWYAVLGED